MIRMGIQQPRKMYEKRGGSMKLLPTALIPRPFDSAYFFVKGGESLLLPAEIDLLESWYDRSLLPSAHGMIGQYLMALGPRYDVFGPWPVIPDRIVSRYM